MRVASVCLGAYLRILSRKSSPMSSRAVFGVVLERQLVLVVILCRLPWASPPLRSGPGCRAARRASLRESRPFGLPSLTSPRRAGAARSACPACRPHSAPGLRRAKGRGAASGPASCGRLGRGQLCLRSILSRRVRRVDLPFGAASFRRIAERARRARDFRGISSPANCAGCGIPRFPCTPVPPR